MQNHEVMLGLFRSLHHKYLGYPYAVIWGKDTKIMKDLTRVYKVQDLSQMISLFFANIKSNKFTASTGATVGIFKTQIPKLLMELRPPNDESRGTLDEEALASS